MEHKKIQVDGLNWFVESSGKKVLKVMALCPSDDFKLKEADSIFSLIVPGRTRHQYDATFPNNLSCDKCGKFYKIYRSLKEQEEYIMNTLDSQYFKSLRILNLDDESVIVAEQRIDQKESGYFVTGLLTESKVGTRLVVYAGKKGQKEKTQIFIEPEIKRLAFDQKDIHPSDVFTKVEANFLDGTKSSIQKESSPISVKSTNKKKPRVNH